MIREIKTRLSLDGEREFKSAMAETSRAMAMMNADLRQAAAEFQATGDQQKYFTTQAELLGDKVKQQELIVEALRQAVEDAEKAYGKAAKQTDDYRIKLSNATAKLYDMRQASEEANRALENMGQNKIEDDFVKSMIEANRALKLSQSEAKLLGVTYRNNAEDADYLAKKSQNLKEQIAAAEKIYIETAEAMKRSAAATGEMSEETVNLKIRTNEARITLTNLRRESEEADRALEAFGRDSNKIGRQIKNGIGDAAEDAGEKLDSMFERVQKDVNALKTSVGFQVATEVGGFVFESIQGIMGFVDENTEFNRKMSQARTVIEMYGYNWDEIYEIIRHATGVIGDYDTAQSALVNLAGAGFENEEQIKATVENLLGIYTSSGGQLDFSGLAEDYLESVKEKSPTGTYAEAIIKFTNRSVEDVQKVLENAKSHADTLEIATGVLTEAGLQNKSKNWVEENKTLYEAETKNADLALAWATLAANVQPTVNNLVDAAVTIVNGINDAISEMEKLKKGKEFQEKTGTTGAELLGAVDWSAWNAEDTEPTNWIDKTVDKMVEWRKKWSEKMWEWFVPSAGAETLPAGTADPGEAGFLSMQQYVMGMQEAADAEVTAAQAAAATAIAQMQSEANVEAAMEAGRNAMIAFGNGIAEGAGVPISNVQKMVNQINAMLSAMASPAYGLGWGGITGGNIALYMDGQKVGGLVAGGVSSALGRKVSTKMTMK